MKKIFTLIAVAAMACGYANSKCIEVQTAPSSEDWHAQFFITLPTALSAGDTFEYSIDVKATEEKTLGAQMHGAPGSYLDWNGIFVPVTKEWTNVKGTKEVQEAADGFQTLAFGLADKENELEITYYFDNISIIIDGVEIIVNGDCEGDDFSNFIVNENVEGGISWAAPRVIDDNSSVGEGGGDEPEQPEEPVVSGKCITVSAEPMVEVAWETQFFVTWGEENALAAGDLFEYSLDLKADNASDNGGFQTHAAPGAYLHWAGAPAKFTTEWATTTFTTTIAEDSPEIGGYTIAVNLSLDGASNVYYFTNISVKVNGEEMMVNPDCTGEDLSQYLVKVAPDDQIIETPAEYVVDGINSIVAAPVKDNRIFNIWGVQVDENYKGIVISNGKKYIQR